MDDFLRKMRGSERLPEEAALGEKYALLRVIFNQADHLMGLLKPDGTVIKINPTAYGFIKGKESDVIGKPFWETPWWTHSPEQQKHLREAIRVAAQGEFVRFEATHVTPEGKLIYVDFSLKPVKDEKQNVVLLVPEGRDITERKKAENALRESEWKFRAIFDQNFQLMGLLAIDGTVIKINRTALILRGVEESDVIGEPFWETPWWTHSPEQQERLREAIKAAARGVREF
jgi:sigma-B regulation protein RsbU (phosphoserine phosphatase)